MIGAIIIGPKWCGKTTTSERHAKGVLKLQDKYQNINECEFELTMDELIFAACRGGWPDSLNQKTREGKLFVVYSIWKTSAIQMHQQ